MNLIYEDSLEGVIRSVRDVPPAHYIFKIESFSLLTKNSIKIYHSNAFESQGYNWKLSLYPDGDDNVKRKDQISLYLSITDTTSLSSGWEVNVLYRLFIYDQIRDKYVKVEDGGGRTRRFHALKKEWGFSHFIPLSTFNDPSNGYLIDDTCLFGAEVFVCKNKGQGECLSMISDATTVTYLWKIERFSQLKEDFCYSSLFVSGDYKWQIKLYPQGSGKTKGSSISIYLNLDRNTTLSKGQKVYSDYKLRLRNQSNGEHIEKSINYWFCEAGVGFGFPNFMTLDILNDTTKGFLVNDTCIIEAEVLVAGSVSNFP